MALNPFFQQGARSEQGLVQDLINEQLRMYGVEVHYMPRKYLATNSIIREVVQSKFDDAYPLEAYVDTYDGYGENPSILSKFGIEQTNEITLTISKDRWEQYIEPLMKNEPDVKLTTRPKEGDLIYFPLGDRLFEIKYVEHEKPFYQLQKTYIYELRCELFRYEDEVIDTGIAEIDDELTGDSATGETEDGTPIIIGPTQTLTLVGDALQATATVGIATEGAISRVVISNRGGGFNAPIYIGFSSAPTGGVTGIATAGLIGGINVCNLNVNPRNRSIQDVYLTNPGLRYTTAPGIAATGGGGTGFAATTVLGDNTVGVVTVTSAGGGYVYAPSVTFDNVVFKTGVTTVSAAGTAFINAAGNVTEIGLSNAGMGYSSIGGVTLSAPDVGSSGTFKFNEIVKGSVSNTEGRVRTWNAVTNVLEVASITGSFKLGEQIVGQSTGASRKLRVIDVDPTDDGFADNFNIETEADKILDFTEQNPFGIP